MKEQRLIRNINKSVLIDRKKENKQSLLGEMLEMKRMREGRHWERISQSFVESSKNAIKQRKAASRRMQLIENKYVTYVKQMEQEQKRRQELSKLKRREWMENYESARREQNEAKERVL